ncbi:MAG: methionine--tRNA ligase, partial [Spartobacteria bacterium]
SLRIVSILISPVLPDESNAMRSQLNWPDEPPLANTAWGFLPDAHQLGDPVPLFPRIEAAP